MLAATDDSIDVHHSQQPAHADVGGQPAEDMRASQPAALHRSSNSDLAVLDDGEVDFMDEDEDEDEDDLEDMDAFDPGLATTWHVSLLPLARPWHLILTPPLCV